MKFSSDIFNDFCLSIFTISSVANSSRCSSSHILLFLHLLLFPSLIKNDIQFLLSQAEFILDFTVSTNWSFNPWMSSNFLNFWSFSRIISNHSAKKILELFTEVIDWSSSWVSFPKSIKLFILQKFVIRIVWNGLFERWVSSIHDEKNNTWGKDITFCAVIIFSWNFRSHVAFSSEFSMKNASSILTF